MRLTKQQEIIQKVISKAWDDSNFKQKLISDPKQAIEQLTGEVIQLPKGKKLVVFDQSDPNLICFNIPPKPVVDDLELTDDDLEELAGGKYPYNAIDISNANIVSISSHNMFD